MKTLIVVRHSFHESGSEELTRLGSDCIDALAFRLQDVTAWKLGWVLTSPKGRALNSATRLADKLRYPHKHFDCLYSWDVYEEQQVLDLIQQQAADNEVLVVVIHEPFVGKLIALFAREVLGVEWEVRSFLQTEGCVIDCEQKTITEVSGL